MKKSEETKLFTGVRIILSKYNSVPLYTKVLDLVFNAVKTSVIIRGLTPTEEEIENYFENFYLNILVKDAKARGFLKGVKVVHLTDKTKRVIEEEKYRAYFNGDWVSLYVGKPGETICILKNKKWTKIIPIVRNAYIEKIINKERDLKKESQVTNNNNNLKKDGRKITKRKVRLSTGASFRGKIFVVPRPYNITRGTRPVGTRLGD